MVIIDGVVRCGRSRNTPPAMEVPVLVQGGSAACDRRHAGSSPAPEGGAEPSGRADCVSLNVDLPRVFEGQEDRGQIRHRRIARG